MFDYVALLRASAASLAVLVTLLPACGAGGDEAAFAEIDESKPLVGPDGALGALVVMEGLPEDAAEVKPALRLTTSHKQAVALVRLRPGVPTGSVAITWYRTTLPGLERLFAHELEARPGQAFSEAVAPGGLAPGLYEVVARLDELQVRTRVVVSEVAPVPEGSGAALISSGAPAPISDWELPTAGDAGYVPEPQGPYPDEVGPCRIKEVDGDADSYFEFEGTVRWDGVCSAMTLKGRVAGAAEQTFLGIDPASRLRYQKGTGTVCEGGGSDLPGTQVRIAAVGSDGTSGEHTYEIPDHGAALVAEILSQPETGSKVKPGDVIELQALAMVMWPALGVERLKVEAAGRELASVRNLAGVDSPVPCEPGRLIARVPMPPEELVEYRVPIDAPPVIEICATTMGFDGNVARGCASFYNGEVWEGTWDAGFHVIGSCTPPVWPQVGTLRATVASDGSLSGRGDLVNHTGVCGGADVPQQVPVTPLFTGRVTDDEIRLEIQLPGLGARTIPMRRTGDVAEGSATFPLGGGSRWEIRARLECTTC